MSTPTAKSGTKTETIALPTTVRGCELTSEGNGYRLGSRGMLGGSHSTFFVADGDHARVEFAVRKGWLATRDTRGLPPVRHMRALRELGFKTVSYRRGTLTR